MTDTKLPEIHNNDSQDPSKHASPEMNRNNPEENYRSSMQGNKGYRSQSFNTQRNAEKSVMVAKKERKE